MIRLFLGLFFCFSSAALSASTNFGFYSNVKANAETGSIDGYEILIVPAQNGDQLIFQVSKGWPSNVIVFDVDVNDIEFVHPTLGKIEVEFVNDDLHLEFKDKSVVEVLKRGKSFWQQ
ncbi:hypothetical protein WMQ46_23220 [Vibrio diabolicus]|uniref:hypothetical protein n=1 Tax=Vibrio diabolicus TaxID=50719 RepID=UPI0037528C0B